MTNATATRLYAAGAEPQIAPIARLLRAWARLRAYRATLAELRALTDGQLAGIGMRRDDLKTIARAAITRI